MFLAISVNGWARAETRSKAERRAKMEGTKPIILAVYEVPDDSFYVNGMGRIVGNFASPDSDEELKLIYKRKRPVS